MEMTTNSAIGSCHYFAWWQSRLRSRDPDNHWALSTPSDMSCRCTSDAGFALDYALCRSCSGVFILEKHKYFL